MVDSLYQINVSIEWFPKIFELIIGTERTHDMAKGRRGNVQKTTAFGKGHQSFKTGNPILDYDRKSDKSGIRRLFWDDSGFSEPVVDKKYRKVIVSPSCGRHRIPDVSADALYKPQRHRMKNRLQILHF